MCHLATHYKYVRLPRLPDCRLHDDGANQNAAAMPQTSQSTKTTTNIHNHVWNSRETNPYMWC